ncbi:MAG TPA: porin [Geminicoccus sp.]|nr:porin [Geminicoccus sp.]
MTKLRTLLGTTALVGAGLLVAAPAPVSAATVSPGGALDLTLTGFARFRAHGGDLDNARLDRTIGGGLDFSNDTEVHVVARGRHDATGIEYGGTIEFEADTNSSLNTDETWLFVRGGFGEFRFGDEDGPVDNSWVGGNTVAAGTGGIDGSIVDTVATGLAKPLNSGDATKVRYYTPTFGGFSAGVSYTPQVGSDGQDLATKASNAGGGLIGPNPRKQNDMVEGALVYTGAFGGVNILASLVGGMCDYANAPGENDDCETWGGGANIGLWGFKLGGGYWTQKLGDQEKDVVQAGVGAGLGPVNLSVTYGKVIDSDNLVTNGVAVGEPQNLVFSADVGLMPGLVLAGDVGWFDNDADSALPGSLDDDGYQAVARLGLAF